MRFNFSLNSILYEKIVWIFYLWIFIQYSLEKSWKHYNYI